MNYRCCSVIALIATLSLCVPQISVAASHLAQPLSQSKMKRLQRCLNDMGFDVGKADGIAGKRTREASKRFLDSIGWEQRTAAVDREEHDFCNDANSKRKKAIQTEKRNNHPLNGEMKILAFGEPSRIEWKVLPAGFRKHTLEVNVYTDHYAKKAEFFFSTKDSRGVNVFVPCTQAEMAKHGANPSETNCRTITGHANFVALETNVSSIEIQCEKGSKTLKFQNSGAWFGGQNPAPIDKIVRENTGDYAKQRFKDVCNEMGNIVALNFTKTN